MSVLHNSYFYRLLSIVDDLKKEHEQGGKLIITINPHCTNYETPEEYIKHSRYLIDKENVNLEEISMAIKRTIAKKCNDENKLITIQLYPRTPVTLLTVFGLYIEDVAEDMIEALIENNYIDKISFKVLKDVS